MKHAYKLSLVYFLLFSLLLLGSSIALFTLKTGFSYEGILHYYAGHEADFIQPKSFEGVLEISWRHLGSIGLLIMVFGHFFLFGSQQEKNIVRFTVMLLFTAALLNIFSPFGIMLGSLFFTVIKLCSIILFFIVWLMLLFLLYRLLQQR